MRYRPHLSHLYAVELGRSAMPSSWVRSVPHWRATFPFHGATLKTGRCTHADEGEERREHHEVHADVLDLERGVADDDEPEDGNDVAGDTVKDDLGLG